MKRAAGTSLFFAAGLILGLASALGAIETLGSQPAEEGSTWTLKELSSSAAAFPYSRNSYLLSGRLPPPDSQMLEYAAAKDDKGSGLSSRCDYVVTLKQPPPAWWSLAAYSGGDAAGAGRALIAADSVIAEPDGTLKFSVSANPQTGNWIRPPSSGGFTLLLSVAQAASPDSDEWSALPAIEQVRC